jgi:hypothetical protein
MATEIRRRGLRGRLSAWLAAPVSIAPLALFRALFGLLMLCAVVRFWAKGWVKALYVDPGFHFTYPGFGWVQPLGHWGTHALYLAMGFAALGMMLGWRYRASAWTFFLAFTYAELLDKTTYLNHYYFVSLVAFLLLWVPAHGAFSLDARRDETLRRTHVARWQVGVFKAQIGLVYFFAGVAKVNADWLLHAQPLALWLPAKSHLPLIGPLLDYKATAYAFSWAGALFDLSIAFLLLWRRTTVPAYAVALVFHAMTAWLFPVIGVFPWVMMCSAAIFLPPVSHGRVIALAAGLPAFFRRNPGSAGDRGGDAPRGSAEVTLPGLRPMPAWIAIFLAVQALLPLRHLLHPGELFWTERGYRFSWRVMLMEKAGHATFLVTDPSTGGRSEVSNCDYLTPFQEKMMATQPDMILDFARHIAEDYARKGIRDPEVRVHSYVTLNGRGSRLYVDSTVNLARIPAGEELHPWLVEYPYSL